MALDRNVLFAIWKTAQMMIRPTTTGSEPRSPERTRAAKAETAPLMPWLAISRSSCRSAASRPAAVLFRVRAGGVLQADLCSVAAS